MRRRLLFMPREPKWKREWRCKIGLSLMIALIANSFLIMINSSDPKEGALGVYNPKTDEIWINPKLDNDLEMRELVVTHEMAHRAFHRAVPIWFWIRIIVTFNAIFVLSLAMFTQRLKLYYVVAGMVVISGFHEIHANAWAMLVHGFDMNSAIYMSMFIIPPLVVVGVVKYGIPFLASLERKPNMRAIRCKFSKKAWKRVMRIKLLEVLCFFGGGIALGLYLGGNCNFFIILSILWSSNLGLFLLLRETRLMGIGTCHIKWVRKKRGRPRKLNKK